MTFVELTTTAGGRLVTRPDAITAVWQVSTYTPPVHASQFPGQYQEPREAVYGFQTRVEITRDAGTFSVSESVDEVQAAIAAARRLPRIFRRVRTVFAKEGS